jgi:adenylate kinase family enzyme
MATSIAASVSAPAQVGQRIVVVGVTSSGKTTLAGQLAQLCALPHVELDALHWEPNWMPAPPDAFRQRVTQALSGDAWVVDGNYSQVRDLVWPRADTIIWLDYPLPLILWRLLRRTIWRITRRPELWNDNRETWRGTFFSRDSLFFWALKTHKRWHTEYPALFARPEYAHLAIAHFRSPRAARQWLASLKSQRAEDQVPSGRA